MKKIFEAESNASQDSRYREHLDRNWQNGNAAFDEVYQRINKFIDYVSGFDAQVENLFKALDGIYSKLSEQDQLISDLNQRIADLENKHEQDVQMLQNKLNEQKKYVDAELAKRDERLKKLEDAVFGYNPVIINSPPTADNEPTEVINTDSRHRKEDYGW